jgi:PBP4 family serine-type D-alanyl-D-alanine carboxypeptidase
LARELNSLVGGAARLGATTGIAVVSIPTGEVLFARNAGASLVPASNMKLISGAVALEELGTDAVFATTLATAAPIESDGTIAGPLVLAGTGDPTLHTEGLVEMARQLRGLGVRRVAGDLIVDSNCIADRGMGEGWLTADENRSFAAQISGLCANWNCVEVTVLPGYQAGAPARVEIEPVTSYVQIEVQATTAARRRATELVIYRDTGQNSLMVKGTIAVGHEPVTVRRTVHEPDLYVGTVMSEALLLAGVVVEGQVRRGVLPAEARVLAIHCSAPIGRIFTAMMKYSANLTCEQLYRVASYVRRGRGSEAASEALARSLLQAAGADVSGLRLADASGLSKNNRLTARAMARLLRHMWLRSPYAGAFFDSLPIAGVDGTLRKRMIGTAAENNLRAKTGTMRGVSSLSGYVTTHDGEPLCFAILMTGFSGNPSPVKQVQDRIGGCLAELRR